MAWNQFCSRSILLSRTHDKENVNIYVHSYQTLDCRNQLCESPMQLKVLDFLNIVSMIFLSSDRRILIIIFNEYVNIIALPLQKNTPKVGKHDLEYCNVIRFNWLMCNMDFIIVMPTIAQNFAAHLYFEIKAREIDHKQNHKNKKKAPDVESRLRLKPAKVLAMVYVHRYCYEINVSACCVEWYFSSKADQSVRDNAIWGRTVNEKHWTSERCFYFITVIRFYIVQSFNLLLYLIPIREYFYISLAAIQPKSTQER